MSIKKIHSIYEKVKNKKYFLFKIVILKQSFLYKFLKILGFKFDLNLSEVDRFPIKDKSINYDQNNSVENYINQIKLF